MMKLKNLINTLMVCVILASCTSKPATSYTIEGSVEGLADGTKMELVPGATHKNEDAVAEAVVKEGKFTFTGATDEPRQFYVRVADSYGIIKIMIENGEIKLTAKAVEEERDGKKVYTFENVEIKGSPANNMYLQKVAPRNALDSLFKAYHENNKEVEEAMKQARIANNKALQDSISQTEAWKKLLADEKNFFTTVESTMKGVVMDNKDSWWGPFFMLDLMSYFTPDQNAWYESFSQEAKDSYYGKIVKEELFPVGLVGKPLPAFTLVDGKNNETTVAALSAGKKYVLVDFWASWCNPCRKEIPNLKKLYAKYASKGFEIISISIDEKEADWKKALEKEQMAWPNFLDTKGAAKACNVKLIPAMFLLDENGVIIAEKIRGEELEAKLDELFK